MEEKVNGVAKSRSRDAMPAEWWESFFSGLWLDVQRQLRAERTSVEAEFI